MRFGRKKKQDLRSAPVARERQQDVYRGEENTGADGLPGVAGYYGQGRKSDNMPRRFTWGEAGRRK